MEERWSRQQEKEDVGLPAHAHSQAWTANVQTSEQPGDRRQVYQGRVAGGVYLATLEGEGGGGYQGGEAGGDCHA